MDTPADCSSHGIDQNPPPNRLRVDEGIRPEEWSEKERDSSHNLLGLLMLQPGYVSTSKPTNTNFGECTSPSPRPMKRKRGDYYFGQDEPKSDEQLTFGGGVSSNLINTTADHKNSDDDPTPETPIPSRLPKRRVISTLRVRLSPSCQSSTLDRDETRSYKCDKCGMSFARPQQLGGHKTVHRANRRRTAVKSVSSSRLIYEGSICHETFGSDQAQGKHQRMHSDPNDHDQVQAPVQPSSSPVNEGDGDVYQALYGNMERRESRRRRPRKQIRPTRALM